MAKQLAINIKPMRDYFKSTCFSSFILATLLYSNLLFLLWSTCQEILKFSSFSSLPNKSQTLLNHPTIMNTGSLFFDFFGETRTQMLPSSQEFCLFLLHPYQSDYDDLQVSCRSFWSHHLSLLSSQCFTQCKLKNK